jgi:hypothetical protein
MTKILHVEIETCLECSYNKMGYCDSWFPGRTCSLAKREIDKSVQLHGFPDFCPLEEKK